MAQGEETYLRSIGKALREARLQAGLTQIQAADRAGVTREYWGHVESQGRNLTFATMNKLATAVGITLSEIVIATDNCSNPKIRVFRQVADILKTDDAKTTKRLAAQLRRMIAPARR